MTTDGLRVSHLTKRFGSGETEVVAVRDVSLDVGPGEVVLLMGPSGSGKTTLLLMLGALLKASEGKITLGDVELTALSEGKLPDVRLRNFGFIFQDFNLLSSLNVQDNVAFAAELTGLSHSAAREKAAGLLNELGLGHRIGFPPNKLSGGEKQRVAIARALINEPSLILADEPTANLDSKAGHETMQLLRRIAKDQHRSVVIVSHDQRIKDIADRVLWLEDGELKDMVAMTIDPVCGMSVERERAVTLTHESQVYYLCSNGCSWEFKASPSKFVEQPVVLE